MIELSQRVIAAYGGEAKWRQAKAVEAVISSGGLAYRLKWQRPVQRLRVRAEIAEPRVRFSQIDRAGNSGVLLGHDAQIENAGGAVLAKRQNAREYFPGGRRKFWWDALDQTYFAGYALWNYLTFPALLLRADMPWREESWRTLEAFFPPHLPTHCEVQRFHFDHQTHLLRQHDYTAEVFGSWAKAAHRVLAHETWQGIPYPSKRRVTPRLRNGRPRRWPVLVWIEVHEWRLV